MENTSTVRIDLQRLQILNDRLCQTLEALNQIRLTAHSPAYFGAPVGYGVPAFGWPATNFNPYVGAPVHGNYFGGGNAWTGTTPFHGYGIPSYATNFFGGSSPTVTATPSASLNNGWSMNAGRVAPFGYAQPSVW